MSIAAAMIVLMQANTAVVNTETPLEAGRWVLRTSIERETGFGGVSATLLSNDGAYRLVVRCDYSYESNLSIQFLRVNSKIGLTALPTKLTQVDGQEEIALQWEQVESGVFARDSVDSLSATDAAGRLQNYYGGLRVEAGDRSGGSIQAVFDGSAGHHALRTANIACAR